MNRFSYLFISILMLGFLSCSSKDDDEEELPQEGLVVTLTLMNTDGEETAKFNEGDDVCFCLKFQNNSQAAVTLPEIPTMIGYTPSSPALKFMRVFADDGRVVGYPYSGIQIDNPVSIEAHSVVEWRMFWLPTYDCVPDGLFEPSQNENPLPAGKYFTQFRLYLDENNPDYSEEFRADFEVVGKVKGAL